MIIPVKMFHVCELLTVLKIYQNNKNYVHKSEFQEIRRESGAKNRKKSPNLFVIEQLRVRKGGSFRGLKLK